MKWLIAFTLIFGLLAPATLDAQRRRGERKRETAAERKVRAISDRLSLSAEQKEKAISLFTAADKECDPIDDDLSKARRELREATRRNAPPAEIDQLAAKIGDFYGRREAIQAKAEAQFHDLLTSEQKTRLDRRRAPARKRGRV